jgi:putative glycosyltransferase (TIGR04372 family)
MVDGAPGSSMRIGRYWLLKPFESFGNQAEDLFFAVLKCRRDCLRLLVLKRKWDLFGKVRFRKVNKRLADINHPLILNNIAWEVFCYVATLVLSISRILGIGLRRFRTALGLQPRNNVFVNFSEACFGQAGLWGEVAGPFDVNGCEIDWSQEFARRLRIRFGPRSELDADFPMLAGKRYVCLHVRTGGFGNDHDFSVPRNANIENYVPAIKAFIDNELVVVRIGDSSMPRLSMDHVLDYAHSPFKSERNDILLIEHCDAYIGSLTGPSDVAALFEKRILVVNCISLSHCAWYREGSLLLPKKVIRAGRELSLKEQIDRHLFEIYGSGRTVEDVDFIENSAEEILEAAKEFMQQPALTSEQRAFNFYLSGKLAEYFNKTPVWAPPENDAAKKNRWFGRLVAAKGSICAQYLRQNWQ